MNIQPLGEQIIIRTIPQDSVGSIIVPDSAKGITLMDPAKPAEAVHFVEAEVVAVGPGRRSKDPQLLADAITLLKSFHADSTTQLDAEPLIERFYLLNAPMPPLVKPGDRILYHPAVQKFDREITDLMNAELDKANLNGEDLNGSRYFIIREESVLAVIES